MKPKTNEQPLHPLGEAALNFKFIPAGGQFHRRGSDPTAVKSRYELLLIPAKMVFSGRRKIVKLAVGDKFANLLKQAYQRIERWLSQTAPHLAPNLRPTL